VATPVSRATTWANVPRWSSWVEHRWWHSAPRADPSTAPVSTGRGTGRRAGPGASTRCWVLKVRACRRTSSAAPTFGSGTTDRLRAGRRPEGPTPQRTARRPRTSGTRRTRVDSRPYLENCTVDASIQILCGQVIKSARWMPWHQEPKKDVGACDKPRGAGNRAEIRGCPNGETRLESCPVTLA
jgi:hypothetical protein